MKKIIIFDLDGTVIDSSHRKLSKKKQYPRKNSKGFSVAIGEILAGYSNGKITCNYSSVHSASNGSGWPVISEKEWSKISSFAFASRRIADAWPSAKESTVKMVIFVIRL